MRRRLPFLLAAGLLAAVPAWVREPSLVPPQVQLRAAEAPGGGELVVIVNPQNPISQLSPEEVTNLFMGRQKRFASGLVALPVEPVGDQGQRSRFYELLLNVPMSQVRAFWARMYFAGQVQPPRQAMSDDEVVEIVLANKGAIGFVEKAKAGHRVKPVLVLGAPPP